MSEFGGHPWDSVMSEFDGHFWDYVISDFIGGEPLEGSPFPS
jgi:hypothetical protein